MTPEVGCGLVLLLVSPSLHRGRPDLSDLLGRCPGLYLLDGAIQPFVSDMIKIVLPFRRLFSHTVGAVHAALVTVPSDRCHIDDHQVAGLDNTIWQRSLGTVTRAACTAPTVW